MGSIIIGNETDLNTIQKEIIGEILMHRVQLRMDGSSTKNCVGGNKKNAPSQSG